MKQSKSIILIIVEGITDKDSLGLLLSNLISNYRIEFYVVKGDVTSEYQTESYNIETKIKRFIDLFLKANRGIKKTDIKEVIQLVDLDGAFINSGDVVYQENQYKTYYTRKEIRTNKVAKVIERNQKKSMVLKHLSKTDSIWNLPYSIYYFSCNIEDVLHKRNNLSKKEKEKMATLFIDKYLGREQEFLTLINQFEHQSSNYLDSWDYIQEKERSLSRMTNLALYINQILN